MAVPQPAAERTPRRERRMSLGAHLIELRRRIMIAALGLLIGMIAGFILADSIVYFLAAPIRHLDEVRATQLVFSTISSGFDLKMRMAFSVGFVLSSPVWLWQLWAFIMPGLTRKEIIHTIWFLGVAIPLFFGGGYVAILVAPHIIEVMATFVPQGGVNFFEARQYYDFILKLVIIVGISFVLPLFLVALNLAGVLTGRDILKGWRVAVLLATIFAAVTTPGADVFSMMLLAGIIVLLYFLAALVSLLFDRRKRKKEKAEGLITDVDA